MLGENPNAGIFIQHGLSSGYSRLIKVANKIVIDEVPIMTGSSIFT